MQKLKNIFILSGFTILAGALNYASYPILIRHLSLEDFATFSVISYLITILAIPAWGFGYFMLVRARGYPEDLKERYRFWMSQIQRYSIIYMVVVSLILVCIAPLLGIHSLWALLLIVLCTGCFLSMSFFTAVLQAREKFLLFGFLSLCIAGSRLLVSGGVLYSPLLILAVISLTIPNLLGAYIFYLFGKRVIIDMPISLEPRVSLLPENSLWSACVIIALVISLQSIDIILVKYLFPSIDVALYAAVSVITKFSLFLIAVLETVSLPILVDRVGYREKYKNIAFLVSCSFTAFLGAYFILPPLGESVLTIIRPELVGSHDLFAYLGIASVGLGFSAIFLKSLILSTRWAIVYTVGVSIVLGSLFLSKNISEFSFYYALCTAILYMISLGHLLYKTWSNSL